MKGIKSYFFKLFHALKSRWALILFFIFSNCDMSTTVSYSPEKDVEAMKIIEGVWRGKVEGGEMEIALCEDKEAYSEGNYAPSSCEYDHIIKGDGSAKAHTEDHGGVGCGGCPFQVVAFVHGNLKGFFEGKIVKMNGKVITGDGYGEPYSLPYHLYFNFKIDEDYYYIDGEMKKDEISLEIRKNSDLVQTVSLKRVEDNLCSEQ